jgi:hypothetical protein
MSLKELRPDIQLSLIHPKELEEVIEYFPSKRYYVYRDNKYHYSFPERWARNQKFGTGYDCEKCIEVARCRGLLFGYCDNCAIIEYKGKRGKGVHYLGYERFDVDDPPVDFNDDSIYHFPEKKYYMYHGKKFYSTFPQEWARNQMPLTGHGCARCITDGMFRNVFIGYCTSCAIHVYKGSRGNGFYNTFHGLERDVELAGSAYRKRMIWWSVNTSCQLVASYLADGFNAELVNSL